MLTVEIASRLRFERGLLLPTEGEFETPRLKEIAVRMHEIAVEQAKLDEEIRQLVADRQAAKNALGSDRTWDEPE